MSYPPNLISSPSPKNFRIDSAELRNDSIASSVPSWRNKERNNEANRGEFGGHRGRGNRRSRLPCRNLQQTGYCRFGDDCRFSHDLGSSSAVSSRSSARSHDRSEETPQQQQARDDYNGWRRLINLPPKSNDVTTIKMLWTKALSILDGQDRHWKQMLPRDLEDEQQYRGREHIQAIMGTIVHVYGHNTFLDLARPFLGVIIHPAFLDCLSVDTFVGSLYNFISGSNGTRAIAFFQRLVSALVERRDTDDDLETGYLLDYAITISIALRELLRREQRAMFHVDLPDLLASMKNCTNGADLPHHNVSSDVLLKILGEIRGIIDHAKGLLHQDGTPQVGGISTGVVTSTYPRDTIIPRDRHDNDKTDFTKINLLPTEGEIRSEHPPFLPSVDINQPHFLSNPVERHLDTQFRLLRHDVFGELNEVLGGMLIALEKNPNLDNPNTGLDKIRAYHYPKAYVRYLSFDQQRGFEAQISFP